MKAVECIDQLFELYEQPLFRAARAILGDDMQAEDAVMDAFLRVARGRFEIDDPRSIATKALMARAVKSASIDLYRRNRRERARTSLSERVPETPCVDPASDSGEAEAMLAGLSRPHREVLAERVVRQRSVAETARRLGISEAAVRKRQERALRALRRLYLKGGN